MTPEQRDLIKRLAKCMFLPGSFDKRFVRGLYDKTDDYELTEKQTIYLEKLRKQYRRQLGEGK